MPKEKILIICPFPFDVAAGQRLKYEQYIDHWEDEGYEVIISPFMDMPMWDIVYTSGNYFPKFIGTMKGYIRRVLDLFRARHYDVVYVFMWVTPIGTSFFERLICFLSRKIIYDVEDNVMMERSNNLNPFVKLLKGRGKTNYLIKNVDHVITSSPFLNDYCLNLNRRRACTYISSSINTEKFLPSNTYSNDNKIVIGWTGTFSSKVYLDLLADVFVRLSKKCDFKLRVIGNFQYEMKGIDLEVIQWTKKNEVKDLQGIDIGVYPLIDNQWILGKSGLKAIQYMSFGIPTVATSVGTTPKIIKHKINGWLVNNDDEWIEALQTLIENAQLRRKIGEEARLTILNNYSTNIIKLKYISILNNLVKNK